MTLTTQLSLFRGDRDIQIRFLGRGHTAGDVVVFLPKEKAVITGDLLTASLSNLSDSYPLEWVASLEALKSLDFDTVIPGHGEAFTDKAKIDYFQAYFRDVWTTVSAMKKQGVSAEEAAKRADSSKHKERFPYPAVPVIGVQRIKCADPRHGAMRTAPSRARQPNGAFRRLIRRRSRVTARLLSVGFIALVVGSTYATAGNRHPLVTLVRSSQPVPSIPVGTAVIERARPVSRYRLPDSQRPRHPERHRRSDSSGARGRAPHVQRSSAANLVRLTRGDDGRTGTVLLCQARPGPVPRLRQPRRLPRRVLWSAQAEYLLPRC